MIKIDLVKRIMEVDGNIVKEGEWISVDGTTGQVYVGKLVHQRALSGRADRPVDPAYLGR